MLLIAALLVVSGVAAGVFIAKPEVFSPVEEKLTPEHRSDQATGGRNVDALGRDRLPVAIDALTATAPIPGWESIPDHVAEILDRTAVRFSAADNPKDFLQAAHADLLEWGRELERTAGDDQLKKAFVEHVIVEPCRNGYREAMEWHHFNTASPDPGRPWNLEAARRRFYESFEYAHAIGSVAYRIPWMSIIRDAAIESACAEAGNEVSFEEKNLIRADRGWNDLPWNGFASDEVAESACIRFATTLIPVYQQLIAERDVRIREREAGAARKRTIENWLRSAGAVDDNVIERARQDERWNDVTGESASHRLAEEIVPVIQREVTEFRLLKACRETANRFVSGWHNPPNLPDDWLEQLQGFEKEIPNRHAANFWGTPPTLEDCHKYVLGFFSWLD